MSRLLIHVFILASMTKFTESKLILPQLSDAQWKHHNANVKTLLDPIHHQHTTEFLWLNLHVNLVINYVIISTMNRTSPRATTKINRGDDGVISTLPTKRFSVQRRRKNGYGSWLSEGVKLTHLFGASFMRL